MAQRKTLNEVQVSLLRWIDKGCPETSVDGVSARISAGALRNRGLVRTSGRGETWTASITDAGKEYLRQVDGPSPLQPRQANLSVTQQLVDEVVGAGGSLSVPRKRWGESGGIDYERRARLAESYGKLPPGSHFIVKAVSGDELLIELATHGMVAPDHDERSPGLTPVPVPTRLSKYHRVAREFRNRTALHEVSRRALPRVLRIVHALALEAERRGYEVACVDAREVRFA
jgi:hypothetical protein